MAGSSWAWVAVVSAPAVFLLAAALSVGGQEYAHCRFVGGTAAASATGEAWLSRGVGGGTVNVSVALSSGLSSALPATVGVSIREFGDLSGSQGVDAGGGVFDPRSVMTHGCPPSASRMVGDLGNFATAVGVVSAWKEVDLVALSGAESVVGRMLVVHTQTDDCSASGANSTGSVLAWCVIGLGEPVAGTNLASAATTSSAAKCVFQPVPANGGSAGGTAVVTQTGSQNARIEAAVTGLPVAGAEHGFHVHWYGDLSRSDATSAGGHFNPYNVAHSFPDPASGFPAINESHVGDLGNLRSYDTVGVAHYNYLNELVKLQNPVTNIIGRAQIVHGAPDDCTGASGNAGPRIAWCVWGHADGSGSGGAPAVTPAPVGAVAPALGVVVDRAPCAAPPAPSFITSCGNSTFSTATCPNPADGRHLVHVPLFFTGFTQRNVIITINTTTGLNYDLGISTPVGNPETVFCGDIAPARENTDAAASKAVSLRLVAFSPARETSMMFVFTPRVGAASCQLNVGFSFDWSVAPSDFTCSPPAGAASTECSPVRLTTGAPAAPPVTPIASTGATTTAPTTMIALSAMLLPLLCAQQL